MKFIVEELFLCLVESGVKVLSLDVFDTLLLRNNKPEALRYFEAAEVFARRNGLETIDAYLARNLATETSYRTRPSVQGCREGHLDGIANIMSRVLGIPETAEQIKEIELNYEFNGLTLNESLIGLINRWIENDGSCILVSDMYLSRLQISDLLRRFGVDLNDIRVFSSADTIVSKRAGLLYKMIEGELGLEPRDFFHVGDSFLSDVRKARVAGWNAYHFPISDLEKRERENGLVQFRAEIRKIGLDLPLWARN